MDLSVATLASLTALLASLVAVMTSSGAFLEKLGIGEAKTRISVQGSRPLERKIWITAVNNGSRTGIVRDFALRMTVNDRTTARSYKFVEFLAVGAKKEANLIVPPRPAVTSESLMPDAAGERWRVRDSLLKMTPGLDANELKQQEDEFLNSFQKATPTCEVLYQTASGSNAPIDPVVAGELRDCAEFMRQAFGL